jgi:hypothetical protein
VRSSCMVAVAVFGPVLCLWYVDLFSVCAVVGLVVSLCTLPVKASSI